MLIIHDYILLFEDKNKGPVLIKLAVPFIMVSITGHLRKYDRLRFYYIFQEIL